MHRQPQTVASENEISPGEPAYAYGSPQATGVIRQRVKDFQVQEQLAFTPDGEGSHALLQIRKRHTNTEQLARVLARLAGVHSRDIGYAGLKDRHAETTQWFSVDLAGRQEPDWTSLNDEGVNLLSMTRHRRKLRRGALRENRFIITIRHLDADWRTLTDRLQCIRQGGVPNYFGVQRFGRNNLAQAADLFAGKIRVRDRHRRGLYLSAARAWLFNQVASERVKAGNWDSALPGDVMMLDGSKSIFPCEVADQKIATRLQDGDIHPTGPLWGCGALGTREVAAQQEREVLATATAWRTGLEAAGLKQQRRALRVIPQALCWNFPAPDILCLRFMLPPGSYATSVLRELVNI